MQKGVMFNKDVTQTKIKRRSKNPRFLLLDCHLEYKKGESQTNIKIMKEDNFSKILEQEEIYIKRIGDKITAFKPDLGITEKGVSDLAQHFFWRHGHLQAEEGRQPEGGQSLRSHHRQLCKEPTHTTWHSPGPPVPRPHPQACRVA